MNDKPRMHNMAVGATLSFTRWIAAGCPIRAVEDIQSIFNTHCKPCEYYNSDKNILRQPGYCEKCGCHVSEDPDNLLNKIRDPFASCPLADPKWQRTIK